MSAPDAHNLQAYDYELPPELIAQRPASHREDSRLLLVDRASQTVSHHRFRDLPELLTSDDLLVLNNTRVVPARFFSNDGRKELLRLDAISDTRWKCLVRPGKKLRIGHQIEIGEATGVVEEILEEGGERILVFDRPPDEQTQGHLALPPYIDRDDEEMDAERYQTVYASEEGAIAAPTAGLHFTTEMLERFHHTFVTLHVGLGTFRPVATDDITEHSMHSERFSLGEGSAHLINGITPPGRVISVGTTVVRVLESCFQRSGSPLPAQNGETDIFIYPPFEFGIIDGLLTNFHLPKSTLLMLISALAGREFILEAYKEAVRERYRFFSYGDCMLIL